MLPERYNLHNLKRAFNNRSVIWGELNKVGVRANSRIHKYANINKDCTKVTDLDWDNLIILDACRYDAFKEVAELEVEIQSRTTCGSHTREFLRRTFKGDTFHDTVYVTANPNAVMLDQNVFHNLRYLYGEHWDEDLMTVPPGVVTDEALEASKEFPDKRLIIHYMQPHAPLIGKQGQEIPQKHVAPGDSPEPDQEARWIWSTLQYGLNDVSQQEVWEAYKENIRIALAEAEELVKELSGKSVITSDHGNLIGERTWPIPARGYGHPEGLRDSRLTKVPIVELHGGERREVTSTSPVEDDSTVEPTKEQLEALGYR